MLRKTALLISTASLCLGLSAVAMQAEAATTATSIKVVKSAYLISAPKLGSKKIKLESTGTKLTRESGGNDYWYHVRDASGTQGYITTNSTYTSSISASTTSSTSTGTPSTENQVVEVVKSAYLIAQPKTGATTIKLEQLGTQLTIESGSTAYWWHVRDASGSDGYITTSNEYTELAASVNVQLPPGVTLDPSITPIAGVNATSAAKFAAILQVAQSKLDTKYILDANEDNGQAGFDCSNFVEYVFHHALGYYFSTASKTQYTSVGTNIPFSDMQPGDLLTFNDGGHSGIYIGNGQMIQCGGGLGKVGYLSVAPGSYWYSHLSAVKQMF